MTTQLTTINANALSTLGNYNLSELDSVVDSSVLLTTQPRNTLSLQGKLFTLELADGTVVQGGREISAIILNVSPFENRKLFEKEWGADDNKVVCYSSNSKAPDKRVTEPKSSSCATCQYSIKGSGANGTEACKKSRNVAVYLKGYNSPFFVNFPITSMISFRKFISDITQQLKTLGKLKDQPGKPAVAPTHIMELKLTFEDYDQDNKPISYPKLRFELLGFVPQTSWSALQELAVSDDVKKLIRIDEASLAEHNDPSGVAQVQPAVVAPVTQQVQQPTQQFAQGQPQAVAQQVVSSRVQPITTQPVVSAPEEVPPVVTPTQAVVQPQNAVATDAAEVIRQAMAQAGQTVQPTAPVQDDGGFII